MGLFGGNEVNPKEYEPYIADEAGSTVTAERIATIEEFLDDDEEAIHMLRVPTIKHGEADESENSSMSTQFTKTGTAAFTDERIVVKIPHRLADDQFIIHYGRIQSVAYNIEGILGDRQFTVTTAAEKYRIGVHINIDDEEVREIVDWVDKQVMRDNENDGDSKDSKSAKERLDELDLLHEDGLISENEYEQKREDIIDDL
jgi:hypothetical protein